MSASGKMTPLCPKMIHEVSWHGWESSYKEFLGSIFFSLHYIDKKQSKAKAKGQPANSSSSLTRITEYFGACSWKLPKAAWALRTVWKRNSGNLFTSCMQSKNVFKRPESMTQSRATEDACIWSSYSNVANFHLGFQVTKHMSAI